MIAYSKNMQIFSTIAYCIAITIAIILRYLLKNKSEKVKKIPLYVIGGIIILLEIGKQTRNIFGYDYRCFFAPFR